MTLNYLPSNTFSMYSHLRRFSIIIVKQYFYCENVDTMKTVKRAPKRFVSVFDVGRPKQSKKQHDKKLFDKWLGRRMIFTVSIKKNHNVDLRVSSDYFHLYCWVFLPYFKIARRKWQMKTRARERKKNETKMMVMMMMGKRSKTAILRRKKGADVYLSYMYRVYCKCRCVWEFFSWNRVILFVYLPWNRRVCEAVFL